MDSIPEPTPNTDLVLDIASEPEFNQEPKPQEYPNEILQAYETLEISTETSFYNTILRARFYYNLFINGAINQDEMLKIFQAKDLITRYLISSNDSKYTYYLENDLEKE